MNKGEAIRYLAKELLKVSADLSPDCFGNVKTVYKTSGAEVTMSFGTDNLSFFAAANIYDDANVEVVTLIKRRSGEAVAKGSDKIYTFREHHNKTNLKMWAVERYKSAVEDALKIFNGEEAKINRIEQE